MSHGPQPCVALGQLYGVSDIHRSMKLGVGRERSCGSVPRSDFFISLERSSSFHHCRAIDVGGSSLAGDGNAHMCVLVSVST